MLLLTKKDIVGKRIDRAVQTPWLVGTGETEGIYSCRVFIMLETGGCFELAYQDPLEVLPIEDRNQELRSLKTVEADFGMEVEDLKGVAIEVVLTSLLWPSIGLLLSDTRVILCFDRGVPGSLYMGAFVTDVCELRRNWNKIFDYWEHVPVLGASK